MSLIIAAVLLVGVFVSAAALLVGVPLFVGLIARDVMESRKGAVPPSKDTRLRIAAERGVARAFVIAGGAFWSAAIFAGVTSFKQTGVGNALLAALYPLVACAVTLIIGWYFERVTAALLTIASFAVVAYGVIYNFEFGVWAIMTFVLIGPMLTAGVLFWLARRDQEALDLALTLHPELALAFASEAR
ncbi:MAG: hypothetical protein CVT67_05715 [Actinobacteria bacterium HGW-Actinobacteria-7]|jgi:hypothetical protein|nr:MAG: hypothetical protein CVT67_05715 [Actinobacteria bacterium HGW-Actinobacteria-7]